MRRTSERRLLPRITAFFAALILCLQMMVVPALAQEDWSMLSITLSWTDASGNPGFAMATPVTTGTEQAFWVQVDPSAPLDQLTITLSHPYYAYTFEPADGSVLQNVQDSGAEMGMMTGIPIIANDAETGNFADSYTLYVSTQSMPVVPDVPTSADVTVNYVYEDNEFIGSENVTITGSGVIYPNASIAGGLQLSGQSAQQYDITVTDGVPSQNPVTFVYVKPVQYADVTVVYQYEDGTVIDTQTKTISESQNIVPESGAVSGLTLTSSGEVYVQVENGVATPNVVTFTYAKPVQYADVTVVYQYEDGTVLDTQTKSISESQNIVPESGAVSGLMLTSSSEVYVQVENGVATPNVVTFTYAKPVQYADVTVIYQYEDGTVLDTQTKTISESQNIVPESGAVSGLTLTSSSEVYVQVENGVATPNVVTFTYAKPVQYVDVTVVYQYEDGTVIDTQTKTISESQNIVPESGAVSGLTLTSSSEVYVQVENGVATPNVVTFTYAKPVQYVDVTVVYQYEDGTVIDTQTKTISESQNVVPESGTVSGLTLMSSGEVYVQVENGAATPNVVTFMYAKPAQSANVTINYQYEDNELIDSQTIPLTETTRIIPESDLVTDLELAESSPREVTVEVADGVANPAVVTFIYKRTQTSEPAPNPVTVTVTIQYLAREDSHAVAAAQTQELNEGTTAVYAAPDGLEAGYVLDGESAQSITVDGNGNASANPVTFYYKQEQVPQATITIRYVDQNGVDIVMPAETRTLDAGNIYPITPDSSKVPAGYSPLKTDAVTVEVNAQGVADKTEVIFYYQQDAVETPIPTGALIQRWGYTNDRSVNWRDRPSTNGRKLATFNQNTYVWMIQEETNDAGEGWTRVMYNGQEGYVMSQFLTVLSQAESDYYTTSNGYTPVPTETAAPTPEATETTAPTDAPTDTATPTSVPAPDTSYVGYALTNQVIALRSTMDQQDSSIMATLPENTLVQVNLQKADEQGNVWSYSTTVLGNQMTGMLLDSALTHISEADARVIIEANATPTASPTATPTTAPDTGYTGYAVTNQLAAIRTGMDYQDTSILSTLPQNTLVKINLQNADSQGTVWSYCETVIGNRLTGMVLDSQLTHIDEDEAQSIINANATATPAPTATPPQQIGYAVARGDNVYMRTLPSEYSDISAVLSAGQVAYVTGQSYEFNADGTYNIWHIVQYGNQWGYIRADLMRLMDQYEVDDYLNNQLATPAPTLVTTPQPYDENSLSSYGYVSANTVNFRKSASTSSTRIATLRQYAFCLVLGTENVNGTTWYKVNYGGNVGYVQGNYFKQMSISELESFLTSEEYKQGIANNASSGNTTNSNNNTSNGSGKLPSAEDQTVNEWTNPNNGLNVSYEPFDPFATPEPLATATAEPSEQPTEAATTIEPMETLPVEYPTEDTEAGGGNGSAIGWVIGAILLLGGGGGGYAYMLHKQNQRKAAQRAAQRRAAAQQQRTSGNSADGRPYARTNAAAQPRTGTYTTGGTATPTAQRPTGTTAAQRPTVGTTAGTAAGTYGAAQGARKPYNTAAPTNTTANGTSPYARPENSGASAYGTQGRRAGRTGTYGTEAQNAYGRTELDNESNRNTSPVGNAGASEQGTSSTATTAGMYGQAFRPNGGASAYGTRGTSAGTSVVGGDSTTTRPTPRRTASAYGTQHRSTVGDQPTQQVPKDVNVDFQPEDNSDL